jgi:polyphosphate kinase 2 (PPK2 family)
MEHLNPRTARVVALGKPTERDRSWYDRAGVERVMGFATDEQYDEFMRQAPRFEQMLAESGVHVTKFWFSVTRSEQRTRFIIRQVDPVRQWKLSPIDLQSLGKWDDYTVAKERMFRQTDTAHAPWTTIKSNDKKRARLNAMRSFLAQFEYADKNHVVVGAPDPLLVARGIAAVGD